MRAFEIKTGIVKSNIVGKYRDDDHEAFSKDVAQETSGFNLTLESETMIFLMNYSDSEFSFCVVDNEETDIEKITLSFAKTIGFDVSIGEIREITAKKLRSNLRHAYRKSLLLDDEVDSYFDLELYESYIDDDINENLIRPASKERIYRDAEKCNANPQLKEELDRIYQGSKQQGFKGHPVHYLFETDDSCMCKKMYRCLLSALHENNRVHSSRYITYEMSPDQRFSAHYFERLYKSCEGGTVLIRYIAEEEDNGYATPSYEQIRDLCSAIMKYRNKTLTVLFFPRECTNLKKLFRINLSNVSFVTIRDEHLSNDYAVNFLKERAKEEGLRVNKKLMNSISEDKNYRMEELQDIFDTWYNDKIKNEIYPQYKSIESVRKENIKQKPKGQAYDELMDLIGLEEAKKVLSNILDYNKMQMLHREKGMPDTGNSMHMVFTGNPGTAKTTVARLFAEILKDNKVLSRGQLVEVGRGDLVGKYVGWTAKVIKKRFHEAAGGVLFIDEAYSLVDDRDGSFGDEAINTIVQEMENNRENVIVIFAGYPDKMEAFLNKNPGLRSRIAFHVPFADYTPEELCDIADLIAKQNGMELTDEARRRLEGVFEDVAEQKDFGNGRYVRNVIEKAKMAQAGRLLKENLDSLTQKDLTTLCADDIVPPEHAIRKTTTLGFCA